MPSTRQETKASLSFLRFCTRRQYAYIRAGGTDCPIQRNVQYSLIIERSIQLPIDALHHREFIDAGSQCFVSQRKQTSILDG